MLAKGGLILHYYHIFIDRKNSNGSYQSFDVRSDSDLNQVCNAISKTNYVAFKYNDLVLRSSMIDRVQEISKIQYQGSNKDGLDQVSV